MLCWGIGKWKWPVVDAFVSAVVRGDAVYEVAPNFA